MAYQPQRPQGQNRNQGYSHDRETTPLDVSKILLGDQIDANLYSDIAEACAIKIAEDRNAVKPSQARRFYDEIVMWDEKTRQNPSSFSDNLPLIKMLKAKLAYAKGRKNIDSNFQLMMNQGLGQVSDAKTLTQFKLFVEAFMGFYKVHGPNN